MPTETFPKLKRYGQGGIAPARMPSESLVLGAPMKWVERLDRVPKPVVVTGTVAITLLIASFDYTTKTELSLAAFYHVPISLAALMLGARFALAISLLSIFVWW